MDLPALTLGGGTRRAAHVALRAAGALAALLAAAGCGSGGAGGATAGVAAAAGCTGASGWGCVVRDVTGDGRPDTVAIRRRGGRFALTVSDGTRTLRTQLELDGWAGQPLQRLRDAHLPSIVAVRQIDGRAGADVAVAVDRSAAGSGLALYGIRGSRLTPLTVTSGGHAVDRIFVGGTRSVTDVDCTPGIRGAIVLQQVERSAAGAAWLVGRSVYVARRATFVYDARRSHTYRVSGAELTRRFPRVDPFEHCRR